MTGSVRSVAQIRHEVAAPAVRSQSPSADHYETVLERYLQAVAGQHARTSDEDGPGREKVSALPVRTVGDVMATAVVSAYQGAAFKEVARALHRNRINAVPVLNPDRHVVGVVSTSDLLARLSHGVRPVRRPRHLSTDSELRRKESAVTAEELMTSPAVTVTPTTRIADAALIAARARVRSLPVVDSSGVLVGMVTRDDLIKQFLREDAEIRHDVIKYVVLGGAMPHHDVTVTVDEGIVTLAGTVATALTARRLVYDATLVVGVLAVEDELTFDVDDSSLLSSGGPIFGA